MDQKICDLKCKRYAIFYTYEEAKITNRAEDRFPRKENEQNALYL